MQSEGWGYSPGHDDEIAEDTASDIQTLTSVTDDEEGRERMLSHPHTPPVRERLEL